MSRLVLIRHAKAEPSTPHDADVDRPLAARGRADAQAALPVLAGLALSTPVIVLVSAAVRTQETYACLRHGLPAHKRVDEPRLYEAAVSTVVDVVEEHAARLAPGAGSVIVIGHNPSMRDVVSHLSDERLLHFPTCAIATLEGVFGEYGSGAWQLTSMRVPRAEA